MLGLRNVPKEDTGTFTVEVIFRTPYLFLECVLISMSFNERVAFLSGPECQMLVTSSYKARNGRVHTISKDTEYTLSYCWNLIQANLFWRETLNLTDRLNKDK